MAANDRTFSKQADERKLDDTRKNTVINSRFESQDSIDAAKQKRQDEWTKVRTASDPKEAPEEKFDKRCLYDQLKENRDKKDDEFAETNKFGNQIRGIDDSEAKFLEQCSNSIMNVEKQRESEDNNAINEFRNAVINKTILIDEAPVKSSIVNPVGSFSNGKTGNAKKQNGLLSGLVKRKSSVNSQKDAKKSKSQGEIDKVHGVNEESVKILPSIDTSDHDEPTPTEMPSALSVVTYSDSSDSCSSCDTDSDINTDLLTLIVKSNQCENSCEKH